MAERVEGQNSGRIADTNLQVTTMLDSTSLFQGKKELKINHQGVPYTLRITSNNKLILTK